MEIRFLADTNIFPEILLKQDKEEDCKNFLNDNIGKLYMSDFSLHSIGVILFRYDSEAVFQKFIDDTLKNVNLVSLPAGGYKEVVSAKKGLGLDFDDAYQYSTAKYYKLKIATMDTDFEEVKDVGVLFL
jgi:predicted nucleic acid-binding protein